MPGGVTRGENVSWERIDSVRPKQTPSIVHVNARPCIDGVFFCETSRTTARLANTVMPWSKRMLPLPTYTPVLPHCFSMRKDVGAFVSTLMEPFMKAHRGNGGGHLELGDVLGVQHLTRDIRYMVRNEFKWLRTRRSCGARPSTHLPNGRKRWCTRSCMHSRELLFDFPIRASWTTVARCNPARTLLDVQRAIDAPFRGIGTGVMASLIPLDHWLHLRRLRHLLVFVLCSRCSNRWY